MIDNEVVSQDISNNQWSRRSIIQMAAPVTLLGLGWPLESRAESSAAMGYVPAQRYKAYFVDSTIPPSLVPFRDSRQAAILKNLGSGYGTQKSPLIDDSINLNNILNKTIAAGINAVNPDPSVKKRLSSASFVFLGMDIESATDVALARTLLQVMVKPRSRQSTALGLPWIPQSLQSALNDFSRSMNVSFLKETLIKSDIPSSIVEAQIPLLDYAVAQKLTLVALAPEVQDMRVVRKEGLQNIDVERRANYVVDAQGFIQTTQDPKFKLYADRSMFKEFQPLDENDRPSDFFAQRILYDEAVATAAAKWALLQPGPSPLMIITSETKDVRFMGGANARIPRVCRYLSPDSAIDDTSVTTILLNPTAKNTLSASNYLRTVIGTAPDTVPYQTKVSDYLWFSETPKVNLLPHMMNPL